MKPRARGLATVAALSLAVPHALRGDIAFSDIHYWTGDGTNSAALVVDWTNEAAPEGSLVWGFRWNGDTGPSVADMLSQIAREDRRLHVFTALGAFGVQVNAIGYDADGDGGQFHYKTLRGGAILAEAADGDDFMDGGWKYTGYWEFLHSTVADASFANAGLFSSWYGVSDVAVEPGQWYVMRFAMLSWWSPDWSEFNAPPVREPMPSESPFAWTVVASAIDTDPDYNPAFNNPQVALGRPALATVANNDGSGEQGASPLVPVTPVMPPSLKKDIVSLANPEDAQGDEVTAFLTVQFDHPVVDDPLNPYGLDLIVFGNSFQSYSSQAYLTGMENPATVTLRTTVNSEPAWVEVSQDGTTWHRFASGPYADGFAPTLGRTFDTNNPVANLFANGATNHWWGVPTDPTVPIDPSVTAASLNGKTLAQVASYYNGSAGGTGFDIAQFPLTTDAQGRKWIRYARVVSQGAWNVNEVWSEIDAFADVYPDLPYAHWTRQHFGWTQLPDTNLVGKSAVAANGKPNFFNAAMGVAPSDTPPALDLLAFAVSGGVATATFPCAEHASDARFFLDSATNLAGTVTWKATSETRGPTVSDGEGGFRGSLTVPATKTSGPEFFRLGVEPYE